MADSKGYKFTIEDWFELLNEREEGGTKHSTHLIAHGDTAEETMQNYKKLEDMFRRDIERIEREAISAPLKDKDKLK